MERTYSVPGISCGHCKNAIETEVGGVDGVTLVDVDIDARTVRVLGEPDGDAIAAAIEEAGYEVASAYASVTAGTARVRRKSPSSSVHWRAVARPASDQLGGDAVGP